MIVQSMNNIVQLFRNSIILNIDILIGLNFLKQAVKPFNILSKPKEKCPMLFRELGVLRKTRLAR
jgi:hypothetical protein